MKRREFLWATAALAGGGSIVPRPVTSAQAAESESLSPTPAPSGQSDSQKPGEVLQPKLRKASVFFEDQDMNYVFQEMLGGAYYRTADIGACLAIADQIVDGD